MESDLEKVRIGIIINDNNKEDLLYYKDELIEIDKELNKKVTFVIFGIKEDVNWLSELTFNFELVKPVSIIHYFKQLKSLNLNLLFIPLIKSIYNSTSENYNKYLEAALINVPVLTSNIYPYNQLIQNNFNGFIFNKKEKLILIIKNLVHDKKLIQKAGKNANELVLTKFNYSEENINIINDLFV